MTNDELSAVICACDETVELEHERNEFYRRLINIVGAAAVHEVMGAPDEDASDTEPA